MAPLPLQGQGVAGTVAAPGGVSTAGVGTGTVLRVRVGRSAACARGRGVACWRAAGAPGHASWAVITRPACAH